MTIISLLFALSLETQRDSLPETIPICISRTAALDQDEMQHSYTL